MEKILVAYLGLGAVLFLGCLLNGVVGTTWHELRRRYGSTGMAAIIHGLTIVYIVTLWPIPLAQAWRQR